MIADLRPPGVYTKPLPKWLKAAYALGTLVLCLGVLFLVLGLMHRRAAMADTARKQKEIATARSKERSLRGEIEKLTASSLVQRSLDDWTTSSRRTAVLQAGAILACAEAEAKLVEQAKAASERPSGKRPRPGRGWHTPATRPVVVLRGMTVTDHSELGSVEVVLDIQHNTDTQSLVTQISAALAQRSYGGLTLESFKMEERGAGTVMIRSSWKGRSSLALAP